MRRRPSKVEILILTMLFSICAADAEVIDLVENAIKAARAATIATGVLQLTRDGEALMKAGELARAAAKFEEATTAERAAGGSNRQTA
jgi:hypothetical protein